MGQQLPLEHSTRMNEQALIDRLMGHVHGRLSRISGLQPPGDLNRPGFTGEFLVQ
jgi:hypothetical protein